MSNRLFQIEIVSIFLLVSLVVLWIIFPDKNWEPWVVLCGSIFTVLEIYRRNSSKNKNEEIDSQNNLESESWKDKISKIRSQKYGAEDVGIIQATNITLEAFDISVENIRTTGGKTGIRIWVSKEYPEKLIGLLHDEIVSLHGKPIAMDVLDYMTEKVYYRANRPPMINAQP